LDEKRILEELQATWSGSHTADDNEINIDGDDDDTEIMQFV
jgi:translation initiation factor 1 (eIF-1/SUI1)